MKFALSILAVLGMALGGMHQAVAQGEGAPAGVTAPQEMSVVAKALEEAGHYTAKKAKPNAKYYIFICSASWCSPCRMLMPAIVEEYQKNIANDENLDLIMLGMDRDVTACKRYLEHYHTDMPGVYGGAKLNLKALPSVSYVPYAFILDAEGHLIASGHGQMVLRFRDCVKL